jgi:hypothetical protein
LLCSKSAFASFTVARSTASDIRLPLGMNKRDENGRIACVLRERPAGRRFDADAVARAEVATVSAGARARCDGECRRATAIATMAATAGTRMRRQYRALRHSF